MLKISIKILFLFSFIIAEHNHRCGFIDQIENPQQTTRSRPEKDTYDPSPNGIFYIHYDTSGPDAPSQTDSDSDGIPDYIEEVGIAADNSYDVIVNELGFTSFILDDDGIYDIYIKDMGPGFYGVNWLDDGCTSGSSSYIEIDNEYESGEYFTTGLDAMRITVAHEFFHAIQRSYQICPYSTTGFFYEMSSTWIEDVVYPDINDYIQDPWTSAFFDDPTQSITDTNGYSIGLYGHYLTAMIEQEENLQSSIIKEIWERFEMFSGVTVLPSIDYVLQNSYDIDFTETWIDFCSRNFFNGSYTDMNNDFYYYNDQIYAQPISYNASPLTGDISVSDFVVTNEGINILALEPTSNFVISLENLDISPTNSIVVGEIVFTADILSNQKIIDLDDFTDVCAPVDYIYLILGSNNSSGTLIDFDLTTFISDVFGDITQNCEVNILDIISIVNTILDYNNGEITPSDDIFILSDLNTDNELNILDIIELVNIIMTIPN